MDESSRRLATREGVASDRIVFTEFGAMKETIDGVEIDRGSRARWLHDASAMENRGWGWTVLCCATIRSGFMARERSLSGPASFFGRFGLNVPKDAPQI